MRVAATAATLLAGLAFAAPAPAPESYKWTVTGWVAECRTKYGCLYGFDISGTAPGGAAKAPAQPFFRAKCAGYARVGPATDYQICQRTAGNFVGQVTSRLRQPPELLGVKTVAPLEVALIFADPKGQPNTYYNLTGFANTTFNMNLEEDPLSFTITPSFLVGIA